MMKLPKNLPILASLIVTACAAFCIVVLSITSYNQHIADSRLRLSGLAKIQAQNLFSLEEHIHCLFADDSLISDLDLIHTTEELQRYTDRFDLVKLIAVKKTDYGYETSVFNKSEKHWLCGHLEIPELVETIERALKGESGVSKGIDSDANDILIAYEPVHPQRFAVLAVQSLNEIRAPLIRSGFIMIALLLMVMTFSYTVSKRLFSKLLKETRAESDRLSKEIEARKSAEASLLQSEHRFKIAAHAVTDLIYEWDMKTDSLAWYGDIDRALGYQSGEIPHTLQAWENLIHPDDKIYVEVQIARHRREVKPIDLEYRVRTGCGEWRIWRDIGQTVQGDDGKPICLIGSCTDITDRVNAKKALLEEKQKAQMYLDVAGTMLLALDANGCITLINRKGCEILGWEKADLIGKTWFEHCLPETARKKIMDVFRKMMSGDVEPVEYVESSVLTKDGRERYIAWHNKLLYDDNHSIIGTLSSGEDITDRKIAEKELRTNTLQLFNALRIAKLGPWQYDVIKDEFTFNDEFFAMFKTTVEEVGGYKMSSQQYVTKFFYPEDAALVGVEVEKFLKTKDPNYVREFEHRIIYADGSLGYIAVRFQVEMNEEGKVVRTYGINQDITELVHQQQEIQESESRIRQIIENSGEGILIADLDDRVVLANSASHRICGVENGTLIGLDLRTFIIPEHHEIVTEYSELRLEGEIKSYDLTIQRPDGELRNIAATASPWRNHDAEVVGTCAIFRDVTLRERALSETRAARKMLQDVIDAIPGTVFWKDRDSVFRGCNQSFADLVGEDSPSNIVGKTDFDMPWTKEESEFYRECDKRIMDSDESEMHIVETQRTTDNKDTWIDTSKIPLHNDDGEVIGILGLYQDITEEVKARQERQKLEEQLRQSQKLETIGTLAGGIAHDFNNLLVPILVTSQILLDEAEKNSQLFEDVEQINTAANRARELVKHILTFSRQTEGERINIDLTQIVKEVVKLLQSSLPSSIVLNYSIEPDCGRVNADPTQIHQVLMNLCTNAYHAIGEKEGRLDIRLGCVSLNNEEAHERSLNGAGDYIVLSVQDNGCGIEQEILSHIFDPFFTTKDVGKGTGLGLSVAHGIAKSHGGTIIVNSKPGKGSVFTLYLPQATTASAAAKVSEPEIKGGNEHILVVDDDLSVAQMVKRILEGYGYLVNYQTDSSECIEYFKSDPHKYDIILTDQIMHSVTGDQLIKIIHEIRPDIPAVVMTGFSTTVTEENYHKFGFDEFIMKPMVPSQLNNAIRKVLDRKIAEATES